MESNRRTRTSVQPLTGQKCCRLTYGNTTELGLEGQKVVFWFPGNAVPMLFQSISD